MEEEPLMAEAFAAWLNRLLKKSRSTVILRK
jgi:hypothetical protein